MITEVRYERLYNLGNFENAKYGATASVDSSGYALAFAECRAAVEQQHALFLAEREAEQAHQRAEWDRQHAENEAYKKRQADTEDLPL